MIWHVMAIVWCFISIFCQLPFLWSYANSIETAVLLVILYDIIWHRRNAIEEIKRDEQAEQRAVQREQALERRQIYRERQEILRKHWQELQSNLISLNRVVSEMDNQRRFIEKNKDSQNATVKQVMLVIANRMPIVLSDFGDFWGKTVAQINVFPQPRDVLALEVLKLIQELGKSVGDSTIEIKDETLKALAELVLKVAQVGTLPNLHD